MVEDWLMNVEDVGEHCHNFTSLVVKTGLEKSHQWILNGVGTGW